MADIAPFTRATPQRAANPVGIIDIGSNSLRLVVYQRLDRVLPTLFNEKAMCGLGRGLETTEMLNPEGVAQALSALERFAAIVKGLGVKNCDVIATAAVRDASNGQDFIREVKQRTGLKIRTIDGAEEARCSAQGVLFGMPEASGIIGDLGGGSLEMTMIERGKIQQAASAPLGPLRLMETAGGKIAAVERIVSQHLGQTLWLQSAMRKAVYPVGGNWRALAKLHMEESGYPLQVVHNYMAEAKDFAEFLNQISRHPERYEKSNAVSKSRLPALPYAAVVLERLLAFSRPERVIFSAYGLREGYMFAKLSPEEQAVDPLMQYAETAPSRPGQAAFAPALIDWTAGLYKNETPERKRLRQAICGMSDVSWAEHPDYRGRHAFYHMLSLPVGTLSHAERAFIALCLYVRYAGSNDPDNTKIAGKLMSRNWSDDALALGLVLRLAYTLTGGAAHLLAETKLKLTESELHLKLNEPAAALMCDSVERRLLAAARVFAVEPKITLGR